MMSHPLMKEWDDTLKALFDEVDLWLEATYGDLYPLHPNRLPAGRAANPEMDGLFNVGAAFSAGYGSTHGRGYVIDVDMVTLSWVPMDKEREILEKTVDRVRELLPKYFPDRRLSVERDGTLFKIVGDFTLGSTERM